MLFLEPLTGNHQISLLAIITMETLMTRPFGWDTLAVKIYELTSEGEWTRAALPGLYLVLAGIIPVFILIRQMEK